MRPFAGTQPQTIESPQNPWVKELRAGFAKGAVTKRGRLAIEGPHLLEEAIRSGLQIHAIFLRTGSAPPPPAVEADRIFLLPARLFADAADTAQSQGIAALVEPPRFGSPQFPSADQPLAAPRHERTLAPMLLIAGGLQDPGNLGTLIRSAEAFGADGAILLPGTVSPWNSKAMRASAGSVFRLPHWAMESQAAFLLLKKCGIRMLATSPQGGSPLFATGENQNLDFRGPIAFLVGNEGAGLPERWLRSADLQVSIPLAGAAESLNAAIAGSVLMFEAARQRYPASSDNIFREALG